jgi:hypothetical protein
MFKLLPRLPDPTALNPERAWNPRGWLAAAILIVCACLAGCDLTPNVLFVADGSPVRLLQLTDAQEECAAPSRVCFLSTWDGQTARGCWWRDKAVVRVVFPNEEQTVPLTLFRPTAYAEYRRASLD